MKLEYYASVINGGKHFTTINKGLPTTREYVENFTQRAESYIIWTFDMDGRSGQDAKIIKEYNWPR